ncbi:chromate transporter [Deinococcus metalli]|uniref:Chromate transporter n=1 Tax=Deinococcus metalli TaxID=1141878 RepID=A0A7W8KAC6_9DEIO|nr:chromate efflux transporter [Deinococcus metalli]MBB5374592.1 chromate transporter [Deinococcus metalli]GHF35161.1 chromate transporter [Deinococcus metalli]
MRALEVFVVFLRLGLTSFGGPVAHLGYFRAEFVARRAWLTEEAYADLLALAQFLPGPASSQTGFAVGLLRAGWPGALAAWVGFTLPSAVLMTAFALGVARVGDVGAAGWLTGLKVAAVAVVAQAVAGMWSTLVTDRVRAALALGVAALLVVAPGAGWQVGALVACALVGWRVLPAGSGRGGHLPAVPVSRTAGLGLLSACGALLLALPLLAPVAPGWALLDATSRAGALVFGGGHVVLPLLEAGFVPHFLTHETFIAGYGAANAVPGPLFTFATYLGAAQNAVSPVAGALLGTVGVFLPGLLLMAGVLPFWSALSALPAARSALAGVNAGVVGLLLAALYSPVFTGGIRGPRDLALALTAYAALTAGRMPAWGVVLGCALLGQLVL